MTVSGRITILCENSVGPITSALGEHGFSALIESEHGVPILFDTGQGTTLLHNARCMNKDLGAVTTVILSHGHYDHTGGLLPVLREFGPKIVLAHPGLFRSRYRLKDNGECVSIGMPHQLETLESAGASFDYSRHFREVSPGIYMTGEVPRNTSFETGDKGLFLDCAGREHDAFLDDQSLIIETDKGLVILLGCCHAGIVNTLEYCAQKTGRSDIYAVIGGTHLGFCSKEQFDQTLTALKRFGISKLAVSHCTGFSASARLANELPGIFQVAQVGYSLEILASCKTL